MILQSKELQKIVSVLDAQIASLEALDIKTDIAKIFIRHAKDDAIILKTRIRGIENLQQSANDCIHTLEEILKD